MELNRSRSGTHAELLVSLAKAYRAQHRYDEAEASLKQALEIYHLQPGAELFSAKASGLLASVHTDRGQLDKAEPLFNQALPVLEEAFGARGLDADYAAILESYAVLLRSAKRNREAERIESRVKAIQGKLQQAKPK